MTGPFVRPAVQAALPEVRRFMIEEIAALFEVPVADVLTPSPMIEARKAFEAGDLERVKEWVGRITGLDPSCFEIASLDPPLRPDQFSTTVLLSGRAAETCSTCGRSERLFEAVPACRGASPGECRNALRRVE